MPDSEVLGWTRLGHLELVRKRRHAPLVELLFERTPEGGLVKTPLTVALEALRALARAALSGAAARADAPSSSRGGGGPRRRGAAGARRRSSSAWAAASPSSPSPAAPATGSTSASPEPI